ncbi:MAG TPA: hypothetical protein VFR03_15425 [Thermoanaerobaculia bacterium]|nr:hypothetical protein [Thermoanaerobaculia bacterium]
MKSFACLLLSVLLAVSLAGPAAAALVPVGDPFEIGTVHPMDISHVAAARPDGTYLVVAGFANRLFGRFVGPGGALIGEELEIDQGPVSSPAVAFGPDGGFVVVYVRQSEIRAAVYDRNGEKQQSVVVGPQRLPELRNLEPSVAVAADGSWMAAWGETAAASPDDGVLYGRWFNPDSTPRTEPLILDEGAYLPSSLEVTAAPDGGFFALWAQPYAVEITPPYPYFLYGRRFDAAGAPLHETVDLSYGSHGRLFPRPEGDGYVLVATVHRPLLLRIDLDGQQIGPDVQIDSLNLREPADAAVDAAGRLLVAGMGLDEVMYARLFNLSTLQPLSEEIEIPSPDGGLRLFKSLASAWPGQFFGLWYGLDFVTVPLPVDLRGQILTLDCGAAKDTLCLRDGRFRVEVSWQDHQGNTGVGHPVPLGEDTGTFWFFSESNVELLVKILDGRGINGRFWVFYGSLSDVEYEVRVVDTLTGQTRTYRNEPGHIASKADVDAFPDVPDTGAGAAAPSVLSSAAPSLLTPRPATAPLIEPACAYSDDALCLLGLEYRVTVSFVDPLSGQAREARGFAFSQESGAFWFFDRRNIELFVKVIDGSAINGRAWVFHGALTDVEHTITVTHVPSLAVWQYHNPRGRMHSGADTSALPPPTGF